MIACDPAEALELIDRELAERSLHEFIRQAWPVLEPARPFTDGWHIGAMCEHLTAVSRGQIRRLILNVPPGAMKSLSVCVFWFCWEWLQAPWRKWMYMSYSGSFATRDSIKCRDLIASDWYQARWGTRFRIRADQDTQRRFTNTRGGFRYSTSFDGGGTGERVDRVVADDPLKIEEANNKLARDTVNYRWDQVFSGRGTDPATSAFVVVMQRLAENDLTGHLLAQGGYEHVCLPMEFEPRRRCVTSLGWRDPREEEGALLWPERFPQAEVEDWKKRLGAQGTAGQLQQRPAPMGAGGVFSNFRHFTEEADGDGRAVYVLPDGRHLAAADCRLFQTCDTAMTVGTASDFTAIVTFALTPPPRLLLVVEVRRAKVEIPRQYDYILGARAPYPQLLYQAVEEKNSGIGIIQEGRIRGTPFKPLKASGDKLQRAADAATMYANGTILHRAGAAWLADFEQELLLFPQGAHDDMADCVSYAGILVRTDALLARQLDGELLCWPAPPPPGDDAERRRQERAAGRQVHPFLDVPETDDTSRVNLGKNPDGTDRVVEVDWRDPGLWR